MPIDHLKVSVEIVGSYYVHLTASSNPEEMLSDAMPERTKFLKCQPYFELNYLCI